MKSEPIDPNIPLNNLQIGQPLVIPEPPPPLKVIMKDGPPMVTPVEADAQVKTEQVEEKEPKKRASRKKKQVETQVVEASADASTSAQNYAGDPADKKTEKHVLVRKNFTKMCRNCYNFNSSRFGAKEVKTKSKRVNTYCLTCPGFPPLCVDCFIRTHKQ